MSDKIVLGALESGGQLRIDLPTLIDSRALITGNSGAGKSRLLRRVAEQAFGKVQIIVIDPEGEFPSLREKHAFALAGRGGEMPAEPRAATLMARRIMELRISVVLDLYDLRLQQQREFVRIFLDSLMALDKSLYRPVLVMIDEAHKFAPERSAGEAESTDAVIALMSQGRKRGLCGIPATQRLSKLHKDAAAEGNNVFVGRTVLDVDQKRSADALGITTQADRIALRDLANGTFLAFGPALDAKGVVTFRGGDIETTHPKAGQRHKAEPPAPPEAVRKLAAELKDLPQEAAEEIRNLDVAKARVRELERELRVAKKATPPLPPSPKAPRVVEKAVLKDSQINRLEAAIDRLEERHTVFQGGARKLLDHVLERGKVVDAELQQIRAAFAAARHNPVDRGAPATGRVTGGNPVSSPRPVAAVPRPRPTRSGDGAAGELTGPEQKILDELAGLEALGISSPPKAQVSVLCGYANPRSGGFSGPLGRLAAAGLVAYPRAGEVALTEAGAERAHADATPLTNETMQERVFQKFDGPAAKILREIVAVYPGALDKAELAAKLNYGNPRSGGFSGPLGTLSKLGLVCYPSSGQVAATRLLFPEGE